MGKKTVYIVYLTNLCEWIAEQEQREIVKGTKITEKTKDRKEDMIAQVLKEHGAKKKLKKYFP